MTNFDASKFSEQSLIQAMKVGLLDWKGFCAEISRRVVAGEYVHPYHAACANLELA